MLTRLLVPKTTRENGEKTGTNMPTTSPNQRPSPSLHQCC